MCPDFQVGLPVGSKNFVNAEQTFTRANKDGTQPVFSLFGGDYFVGEVLEGKWLKGNDGSILGPFTAKISGGELQLTGRSTGAGVDRYGWVQSKNKINILDDVVLDVHLKLPSHSGANDFMVCCVVSQGSTTTPTGSETNCLQLYLYTDNTNYKKRVYRIINGSGADLFALANITNAQGTFRIKFEPDDDHLHIYFHDGAGAIAEATDEITGSPFDYDTNLNVDKGYVTIFLRTSETTNRIVSSEKITVTYPDFIVKYDLADADVNKSDCKCFDTMGSADESAWARVLSEDHKFTGDCVVENGLIRVWVDNGVYCGLKIFWWNGSAYTQAAYSMFYQRESLKALLYPFLAHVIKASVDECAIVFLFQDSATDNRDYYLRATLTLRRGNLYLTLSDLLSVPLQEIFFETSHTTVARFGYAGNSKIGDSDLSLTGYNYTMSDNFMMGFDDAGQLNLLVVGSNKKPAASPARLSAYSGGDLYHEDLAPADIEDTEFYVEVIPFSLAANLFKEAEDATLGGGATAEADAGASGGQVAYLNAQNEYVQWSLADVLTKLPMGRYILFFRIKDTNQVANDLYFYVYNVSDSKYLNEDNTYVYQTVTAAFVYYGLIFDLTSNESGNTVFFEATKSKADANAISIDYFLIVPIGNGESWSQDLAHSALRDLTKTFTLSRR